MLKLDAVTAFIGVAETGSMSGAARRLGLSKSVISDRLSELKRHRAIVYSNRGAGDWRFKTSRQLVTVRPETVVMRVNNGLLMRSAAVAGLGLALLPTYFIRAELARKRLAVVDVGADPEGAMLYLAYPHDRRASAKLRALGEWLREAFGTPPYWDA